MKSHSYKLKLCNLKITEDFDKFDRGQRMNSY